MELGILEKNKTNILDLSQISSEAAEYISKYAKIARKKRGEPPYLSIYGVASESNEVSFINGKLDSYSYSLRNNTVVTAHYPPAKPVFILEKRSFSPELVWRAEAEAWQNLGHHKHSRFIERDFYLMTPENPIASDKVKLEGTITENDLTEMSEFLVDLSKEVKGIVDNVECTLQTNNSSSLHIDVNGSEIFQDLNYWYVIFKVGKRFERNPSQVFELSYTLGASEGLRSFEKLKEYLRKGVLSIAEESVKFSKASSKPEGFILRSGTYKAVLDGRVAGVALHELGAGHLAEAHRVLDGDALAFEGKFGKRVSSSKVTIIDDSTFELDGIKPISFYKYDAEGVRKKKVEIIKNGVFKSYLHSKLTAGTLSKEEGGGVLTGNARIQVDSEKENIPIVPRMSTLYLEPGSAKFEEMLEVARGGLLITSGAPAGVALTGIATGLIPIDTIYWISPKHGPLPILLPNHNVYIRETSESFLDKIKLVGDRSTLTFDVGFCGAESGFVPHTIYSPAIFVNRLGIIICARENPPKPPLTE